MEANLEKTDHLDSKRLEKLLLTEICERHGVKVKIVEFLLNRYREFQRGEITRQTLNKRISEALDALSEEVR